MIKIVNPFIAFRENDLHIAVLLENRLHQECVPEDISQIIRVSQIDHLFVLYQRLHHRLVLRVGLSTCAQKELF